MPLCGIFFKVGACWFPVFDFPFLPPANEVLGKVIFWVVCVKVSVCGGAWSQGGSGPSMPCRFPGPHPRGNFRGIWLGEGRSPGPHPRGKLREIWSRPMPKGEVEGDLVQVHTQGGSWGESGPCPHPRGKLRGIWSRPTPKGEVEGDLVQAYTQGESWGGSGPSPQPGPHPHCGYCCGWYASYSRCMKNIQFCFIEDIVQWWPMGKYILKHK